MTRIDLLAVAVACGGLSAIAVGAADWAAALSAMPLPANAPTLNRSNAIRIVLENFRSNDVVKAIVVLPGVADDLYLINRDRPMAAASARHVADAVVALTNLTLVRSVFTNALLLLHTDLDRLQTRLEAIASNPRPDSQSRPGRRGVLWIDAHWRSVQPALQKGLGRAVRPTGNSQDAWHFERANLAAFGLTDAELINAVALTTGTRVIVQKRAIAFERRSR